MPNVNHTDFQKEFDFELPRTSKWHKPAINRIVKIFDLWAEVEISPQIIVKLDLIDLKKVMKYRWNLKRGSARDLDREWI